MLSACLLQYVRPLLPGVTLEVIYYLLIEKNEGEDHSRSMINLSCKPNNIQLLLVCAGVCGRVCACLLVA